MNHYYEFFDRTVIDHFWRLSWKTVMKRNRGHWFSSGGQEEAGAYSGESLRQLLAFSLEPTPTVKQLERMLARLRSDPQDQTLVSRSRPTLRQ